MYCFFFTLSAIVFVNIIKPCSIWCVWYISSRSGNRESNTFVLEGVLLYQGVQLILTWQGRHRDQEGGSPRARLSHCTPGCADPCEFLKCGNLDCIISGSGGLRSRSPLILMLKIIKKHSQFDMFQLAGLSSFACWEGHMSTFTCFYQMNGYRM